MKLEGYAWNKHEQKMKTEQTEFKYSNPKIKIVDNIELRNEIEVTLEKIPQKFLAQWALGVASVYLDHLESQSNVSKYSARSFAQAIGTGHMRGHALVSSDYAIKVRNLLTENSLDASTEERVRQLRIIDELLNKCI